VIDLVSMRALSWTDGAMLPRHEPIPAIRSRADGVEPPGENACGLVFENRAVGSALPPMFVAAVEKTLAQCMSEGTLAGYPVIGLKAILLDGATQAKDSTPMPFECATRDAFRAAFAAGQPQLLEPVMQVFVTTPGDYLGTIIADLQSRRGKVTGSSVRANVHEV
jgi:elongation factor G